MGKLQLMKKAMTIGVLLSLVFLLVQPGFACLLMIESSMDPSMGQTMDLMEGPSSCCAINCRFVTTPEPAKRFCDQTQREAGRTSAVSKVSQMDVRPVLLPLDILYAHIFFDPAPSGPLFFSLSGYKQDIPPKVDRNILCRTLLI